MKIVFVTNFMNIHQIALTEAFLVSQTDDFKVVSTTTMDADRKEMHFDDYEELPYVICSYKSSEDEKKALEIINTYDIAIFGSAPRSFLKARLKTGKLTFKFSERFFKENPKKIFGKIDSIYQSIRYIRPMEKHNLYFLCAGAYVAADINKYANFKNRTFKWGYFREVTEIDIHKTLENKQPNTILWVARLIEWKHPELMIELAKKLKAENYNFNIKLVGNGDMRSMLQGLIEKENLENEVSLCGSKTPDEVKQLMMESQIAVSTSDFKEGWGVVVNEAMNCGCAVVASHAMGAVPYLINNGFNGMIFENENIDSLFKCVTSLLNDIPKMKKMGENAYNTLIEEWNANVAVERFYHLVDSIYSKKDLDLYEKGPCSKANILPNEWFKEE